MITINGLHEMESEMAKEIDTGLRSILDERLRQLAEFDFKLEDLARFLIVEPGDALHAVEAEAGFPIAINFVDGVAFGSPDFVPSWEWIKDHGKWFEFVFILSDDGFGNVVLVPNAAGVDARILQLCRQYAAPPDANGRTISS
jgi:hypothetical protein